MSKDKFNNLVICGFDVEFNYKEIFCSITLGEIGGRTYFFLTNENKWNIKFEKIEELDEYILIDKKCRYYS